MIDLDYINASETALRFDNPINQFPRDFPTYNTQH